MTGRQAMPSTLMQETSWGAEEWLDGPNEVIERYPPPLDLVADMLVVAALAPAAPLARTFPAVSFMSAGGRVPLLMWFSQITRVCAGDGRCEGDGRSPLYGELTILAQLRGRKLFMPGIYATSRRSLKIGWRYGMPKEAIGLQFRATAGTVRSEVEHRGRQSVAWAHLLGTGEMSARLGWSLLWPLWSWPIHCPSGRIVRGAVCATPRIAPARVAGWLSVDEPWLPRATQLLPLGAYAPGLRMRLPPPDDAISR